MSTDIAIVGSGAAGTLTAWRLRALLGDTARLHVFECDQVGGRARHIEFAGERVELGGTLIHTDNRRIVELAAAVGLPLAPRRVEIPAGDGSIALWDGHGFLLRVPDSGLGLPLGLVRRYGPFNLLKLRRLAQRAKAAWNSVYALQEAGRVFETPDELIRATGLDQFVKISLTDLARRHGISDKLVGQFVTGVLRDMYNQTSDIVALAGLVGLAGAGLAGGSLVASTEGNATLFAQALDRIGADIRVPLAVTAVRSDDSGVTVTAGETCLTVDAVVLAAPLELAGIEITTPDGPLPTATGRRYQDVHVTVVAGEAEPAFFGGGPTPGDVLTTADPDIGFKAFAQIGHSQALAQPIWKFFSAEELSDDFLGRFFRRVAAVHHHLWQAYPVLTPDPSFHPFRLARGVYQVNDFESAVSTLETEATIGWSVADLVARDLKRG